MTTMQTDSRKRPWWAKGKETQPGDPYRQQIDQAGQQARQQAADYRQQDTSAMDGYRRNLAAYRSRLTNPGTYRPAAGLAMGQAGAASAYDAEATKARTAATLGRTGLAADAVSSGGWMGAETQRQADVAAAARAATLQQIEQRDQAERDLLQLERLYGNDLADRTNQQESLYLGLIRALMGDAIDREQRAFDRRENRMDRESSLIGGLAAALGGVF